MQIISSQNPPSEIQLWGWGPGHHWGAQTSIEKQLPPLCETVTLPYYWKVLGSLMDTYLQTSLTGRQQSQLLGKPHTHEFPALPPNSLLP